MTIAYMTGNLDLNVIEELIGTIIKLENEEKIYKIFKMKKIIMKI